MEGNEAARRQLDESLRRALRVPHVSRALSLYIHMYIYELIEGIYISIALAQSNACSTLLLVRRHHQTHHQPLSPTKKKPTTKGTGPKGDLGEALRRIDAVLDDKGLSLLRARLPRAYAEYCQGERLLLEAARE